MSFTRRHFLAASLLEALQEEGWKTGTGQYLRLQEVLRQLPSDADDDALRLALAPLFARNAREQEKVYELFEQCRRKADELAVVSPDMLQATLAEPELSATRADRFSWIWLAFVGLLFVLFFYWRWYENRHATVKVYRRDLLVYSGQPATLCPEYLRLDSFPTPLSQLTPQYSRPNTGNMVKLNDTCIQYTPLITTGSDSLRLDMDFRNGERAELELHIAISTYNRPDLTETSKGKASKSQAERLTQRNLPYPHNIAQLALEPPSGWVQWLGEWLPWLRWIAFAALLLILYAVWRYWEWKRRKLIAELRSRDKPPYIWNIQIAGTEEVFSGDDFANLLRVLRRRAASDTYHLDLNRSIAATAERGGMPEFRFRQHTRPVDYLLLIDRQNGQNHRAQLFNALYAALRAREIEIARFYYDSDIRICHNEEYPNGIRLTEIAQRWGEARLIITGTGTQLISPVSGKVEDWAAVLQQWRESALFTPKAPEEWGRNERRLGEYFSAVLPATLESLAFWADEIEAGEDARLGDWPERLQRIPAAFIQPDEEHPLPMLRLQFDPDTLKWIAACAIFPSLHWDLSLWLYRRLSPEAAEGKAATLSENALRALTQLRWFVEGKMPGPVRSALLTWFQEQDAELLARLRVDLAELLRQHEPPPDSAAWIDHRINVALTEWQATTDRKKRKELEKEVARLLEAGADADLIALKPLQKVRSPLDFVVPQSWKKYVHPGGLPGLGNRLWPFLIAFLIALLGGFAADRMTANWLKQQAHRCAGNTVEYKVSKRAFYGLSREDSLKLANTPRIDICLRNQADSLLWLERLALDNTQNSNYEKEDTLFSLMAVISNMHYDQDGKLGTNPGILRNASLDSLFDNIRQNIAIAYWNQAINHTKAGEPFAEAPGDSACWLCNRAWQRYNGDDAINIQHAKCEAPGDACPPEMFARIIRDGDNYFVLGHFDLAILKYRAALACRPDAPEALLRIRNALKAQMDVSKNETVIAGVIEGSQIGERIVGAQVLHGEELVAVSDQLGAFRYAPKAERSPVKLLFTKPGYQSYETDIRFNEGVQTFISVRLEKLETIPVPVDSSSKTLTPSKDSTTSTTTTPPGPLLLPEMVFIPGGTFTMGSPDSDPDTEADEKPAHQVTVSDFSLGKYEVTNEEYAAFLNEKGNLEEGGVTWINLDGAYDKKKCRIVFNGKTYSVEKGYERFPVIYVSWYGAKAYCDWLSEKTVKKYRLPTEAEWEYAARGGRAGEKDRFKYAGSDNLKSVGWYYDNSDDHTHEVGKLAKNQTGLFDMSGNVWEWCQDWYGDYSSAAQTNPTGSTNGSYRVLRGGSWFIHARYCRVSYRNNHVPAFRNNYLGFRLASSPQ